MCGDGGVSVGSGHCINKTLWSDKGEGEGEVGRFRRGKKRDPHSCLSARCTGIFACAFFFFLTQFYYSTQGWLFSGRGSLHVEALILLFFLFFSLSARTHTHTHTHTHTFVQSLLGCRVHSSEDVGEAVKH